MTSSRKAGWNIPSSSRPPAVSAPPTAAAGGPIRTLAGGGVLLHDCYALIDQLLWSFSIPEQVYALQTNQAPDKQQRLYLTEDTALVCLRFTDALMGSLVATRRNEVGPYGVAIEIHAKNARLTVTEDQVELRTGDGRNDLKWQYDEDEQVATSRLLTSFARSVRSPQEHPFPGRGVGEPPEHGRAGIRLPLGTHRLSGAAGTHPAVGRQAETPNVTRRDWQPSAACRDECLTRIGASQIEISNSGRYIMKNAVYAGVIAVCILGVVLVFLHRGSGSTKPRTSKSWSNARSATRAMK